MGAWRDNEQSIHNRFYIEQAALRCEGHQDANSPSISPKLEHPTGNRTRTHRWLHYWLCHWQDHWVHCLRLHCLWLHERRRAEATEICENRLRVSNRLHHRRCWHQHIHRTCRRFHNLLNHGNRWDRCNWCHGWFLGDYLGWGRWGWQIPIQHEIRNFVHTSGWWHFADRGRHPAKRAGCCEVSRQDLAIQSTSPGVFFVFLFLVHHRDTGTGCNTTTTNQKREEQPENGAAAAAATAAGATAAGRGR